MVRTVLTVVGYLILVAAGVGLIFGGFEMAAYEKTISDREVTTTGTVLDDVDDSVRRLPDGNWTYAFDFEYEFDQEAEITAQGLESVYAGNGEREMQGHQRYVSTKDGGTYDSQSDAADAMRDNFEDDGSVTVYVDPFYPDDGSLSDATSLVPRALQYGGSVLLFIGLGLLARQARRVSS